ncbi:hypothetical protein C8255_06715 [filamentous cyanobacterium CCP3]|nr:hypothetical protein C8255_06715 [filamentous cyanobacterium CCP3]
MMGELAKVEIRAFKDKTFRNELGKFELPINPEQFSQSFRVAYDQKQSAGADGNDPEFKAMKPEELVLNFTIDGTGVVPIKGKAGAFHKDVTEQVEQFLKLAYVMNGETHRPNFLRLLWGKVSFGDQNSFDCILKDLNIDYTLFSANGKPLRAKLKATFISYIEAARRVREEGKQSPDVTHMRMVEASSTLPLMTEQIYGDQTYYLQVAKANGLVNFRKLKTSKTLRFPPI